MGVPHASSAEADRRELRVLLSRLRPFASVGTHVTRRPFTISDSCANPIRAGIPCNSRILEVELKSARNNSIQRRNEKNRSPFGWVSSRKQIRAV